MIHRSASRAVRPLSPIALIPVVAVLAACGGEDPAEPDQSPSASAWRGEANAICAEAQEAAIGVQLPGGTAEAARFAEAMSGIVSDARERIAALEAPEQLRSDVDAYLGELDEDLEVLDELRAAGEDRDRQGVIAALDKLDESAGGKALQLDLRNCAAFANAVAKTP